MKKIRVAMLVNDFNMNGISKVADRAATENEKYNTLTDKELWELVLGNK